MSFSCFLLLYLLMMKRGGGLLLSEVSSRRTKFVTRRIRSWSSVDLLINSRQRRRPRAPAFHISHEKNLSERNLALFSSRTSTSIASAPPPGSSIVDEMKACWKATSWTVNPQNESKIDITLQGLASPAPQSYFVLERASQRDRLQLIDLLVKDGHRLGQNDDGNLVVVPERLIGDDEYADYHFEASQTSVSVAELARRLLDHVLESGESAEAPQYQEQLKIIHQRLNVTLGTDARGRTAADVMFLLALAGVVDDSVYEALVTVAQLELHRVRRRTKRNIKDVLHVCEKVAASGAQVPRVQALYDEAQRAPAVTERLFAHQTILDMQNGELDLLADRPLLWLWRHAAKQTKPTAEEDASYDRFRPRLFDDPERPLVVDIGCGMGTSLIGLASLATSEPSPLLPDGVFFPDCNFLGIDLNHHGIGFARGIARRWDLTSRLQYLYAPADVTLGELLDTHAHVAAVLVQFPSPYRLKPDGNAQLPADAESGFMVSRDLLNGIHTLLSPIDGRLLLQSNAEDVALQMRRTACDLGFVAVHADAPSVPTPTGVKTQRTNEWIRLCQPKERATGPSWWMRQVLPMRCATETEVACRIQKTSVHRSILRTKA